MLCIRNEHTDPYFNLAAEEYLFRHFTSAGCCMLYRNAPSVIVGKHQNTLAEINRKYVRDLGIRVARRLTGGGTVFHDQGNLNFCIIQNGEEGRLVDFRKYTEPVLHALKTLGLQANLGSRNEILMHGLKISGNAEHVYRNRVMHHGTLLFSSDLRAMAEALRTNPSKYNDKAVKSVRSQVINISGHLPGPMNMEEFTTHILNTFLSLYQGACLYEFTTEDSERISDLAETKYSTWEWIYGYSPSYLMKNKFLLRDETIRVEMSVSRGVIHEMTLSSLRDQPLLTHLAAALQGQQHREEKLRNIIHPYLSRAGYRDDEVEDIIDNLF